MVATTPRRNTFFLLALSLAFAAGNLISLSVFRPEIRFTPLDIAVCLGWILALMHHDFSLRRYSKPFLAFVVWIGLSLLLAAPRLSLPELIVSLSYALRWVMYAALPLSWLKKDGHTFDLVVVLSFLVALIGFTQYLFLPDTRFLAANNWDDHYYRIIAPFLDPGFTGFVLAAGSLILLNKLKTHPSQLLLLGFLLLTLALTYSRSSYLALVAGLLFLYFRERKKIYLGVLGGFALLLVFLPRPGGEGVRLERTNSSLARLYSWATAIELTAKHPIIGVGFNTYRYSRPNTADAVTSHAAGGSDSSLLTIAATTGLVGLVLYLVIARRLFTRFSLAGKSLLLALFVHSFFLNSQLYPPILLLIALLPRHGEEVV